MLAATLRNTPPNLNTEKACDASEHTIEPQQWKACDANEHNIEPQHWKACDANEHTIEPQHELSMLENTLSNLNTEKLVMVMNMHRTSTRTQYAREHTIKPQQ